MAPNAEYAPTFHVGQRVRVRDGFRQPGDFDEAVIWNIDAKDGTIDVRDKDGDWGQWFCRLADGTYEIEPVPTPIDSSGAPS
jgi:hypothetical protein